MPKTSVSTKVDDELLALLQERAARDEITQSQVIHEALKKHLFGFEETTPAQAIQSANGVELVLTDTLIGRLDRLYSLLGKTTESLSATTPLVKRIDLEMARVLSGDMLVIGCLAELVGSEKFEEIAAKAKAASDDYDEEKVVLRAPQRHSHDEELAR